MVVISVIKVSVSGLGGLERLSMWVGLGWLVLAGSVKYVCRAYFGCQC